MQRIHLQGDEMKIIVNNEQERQAIINVCDAALGYGRIKIYNEVGIVMRAIQQPEPDKEEKKDAAK